MSTEHKTRDKDIRRALHDSPEIQKLVKEDSHTLLVDELGLCQGNARIDVAVINGHIHGFEIKSDKDTLNRLPCQINEYNKVFDTITVVGGVSHLNKATSLIPDWWGIKEAVMEENGSVSLYEKRPAIQNPSQEAYAIAQLLWKNEVISILKKLGLSRGMLSKNRPQLWKKLSQFLSIEELKLEVRETLKHRESWRSG